MDDSDQQSGAFIGSNADLLADILLRLPLTSILRFKSVSKHWLWLLSHRSFTHRYDNNNLLKSLGLFASNTIYVPFDVQNQNPPAPAPAPAPSSSLDIYFDRFGITIVQSCNGLLLCCSDFWNKRSRKYYVFNLATKQYATISPVPGCPKDILDTSLAFHQTDCVNFKVVCLCWLKTERACMVRVYSSDTGMWKVSVESFYYPNHYFYSSKGVYLNGVVHWALYSGKLLCYNIKDEQLQTLPLSLPLERRSSIPYFGESRGHLHLVVAPYSGLPLTVYEMLSDCSGLIVKYKVKLDGLPSAYSKIIDPSGYNFDVLDVVRGEKEEDTTMVLRIPGKLIKYNLRRKSFNLIFSILGNKKYGWSQRYGWSEAHRYIPALSSF